MRKLTACATPGVSLAENDAPADDGINYIRLLYLFRGDAEEVLREHSDVRELARGERAFVALGELGVGARRGVSAEGFFNGDLLFGNPAARVAPINCSSG